MRSRLALWFQCVSMALIISAQLLRPSLRLSDGLGWDGLRYAPVAANITTLGANPPLYEEIDFIRFLPSVLVGAPMRLFVNEATARQVVIGFKILNSVATLVSWVFFLRISRLLRLSPAVEAIAFGVSFLTFQLLVDYPYSPVTTDAVASALGLATYYFYLQGSRWRLAVTTLLCGFCWPSGYATGLALLLVPAGVRMGLPVSRRRHLRNGLIALSIFGYALLFFLLVVVWRADSEGSAGIDRQLVWLSAIIALAYVCMVQSRFAESLEGPTPSSVSLRPLLAGFLIAAGIYVLRSWIVREYSIPTQGLYSRFVFQFFLVGLINPGHFLAGLFITAGPVAVWLLVCSREMFELCREKGLGLQLALWVTLLYAVHGEGRLLVFHLPLFLIMAVALLGRARVSWKLASLLIAVQILHSRFWFRLDIPWESRQDFLSWPEQSYFMNFPPWLNRQMWIAGLAGFLICLGIMLRMKGNLVGQPKPASVRL